MRIVVDSAARTVNIEETGHIADIVFLTVVGDMQAEMDNIVPMNKGIGHDVKHRMLAAIDNLRAEVLTAEIVEAPQ